MGMRTIRVVAALAAIVISVGAVEPAQAASTYVWSVDGSVANSGLPAGLTPDLALGPNVTSTKDRTTIEIAGKGRFTPKGRWIDGGGDYRVLDAGGRVLAGGRWKPVALDGYRDLGTEPEGSPAESLRAGIIRARIALEGLGAGRLTFYCGAHGADGEEIEGVNVAAGRWWFTHIDAGSTTIDAQ
jgi:hypothetical protein